MFSRRALLATAVTLPAALAASASLSAEPPVFQGSGLAIQGYDTVAYFDGNGPVKGSVEHSSDWNGATWHFASAENKALFDADPEAYAPQYGGYCAFAVSKGYIASTDPDAWSLHEGKLYLNYSKSVRARWALRKRAHIESANQNWPAVLG